MIFLKQRIFKVIGLNMKLKFIADDLWDGIKSLPSDLFDGMKRTGEGLEFWNKEQEIKIGGQNDRAYNVLCEIIKYGLKYPSPIFRAIKIILSHFYESLSKEDIKKAIEAAAIKGIKVSGKLAVSYSLSVAIARIIEQKVIGSIVYKKMLGYIARMELNLLAMQGILYKAGQASDKLKCQFPKIWLELSAQNLDMIYFLIEEPMQKYLDAIRYHYLKMPIGLI
jgi:hypothetical protein